MTAKGNVLIGVETLGADGQANDVAPIHAGARLASAQQTSEAAAPTAWRSKYGTSGKEGLAKIAAANTTGQHTRAMIASAERRKDCEGLRDQLRVIEHLRRNGVID